MTHFTLTGIAMLTWLGSLLIAPAVPAAPPQAARELSASETTSVKATIVRIDRDTRNVTLRGPKGNDVVVYADEKVQRFNELKVGDIVTAVYSQALAVRIRKPGAAAPASSTEKTVREADNRGATITRERTVSVTVQEIDIPGVRLTVKDSKGSPLSFKVRDVNQLRELKVGDQVDVTYTEGLLVRADRAQ
jgi:Cu/Ag efflux protein CusF